jgi:two-component system, cell cycle response regulator
MSKQVAPSLEEIITCQQLPSLPSIAMCVIELSEDPDAQIPDIAEVIQNDQALTAKILRTVNSSYYGLAKPCETITRAMTYLGMNTIKSLVLGFSLVRLTDQEECGSALIVHWRRAIFSAAAARRIAGELGHCDPEEAFIAALMQDIGALAMHAAMKGEYARLIERAGPDHFNVAAIEQRELGFDHAEVGAALGERWKLPKELVQLIRHHHDLKSSAHYHLLQTITLGTQAAEITALVGTGADETGVIERFNTCAMNWYQLDPSTTASLMELFIQDARQLAGLLDVNVGDPPNIGAIMSRAEELAVRHQLQVQREAERLQRQNATLSRLAMTCGLTGLANRRRFDEELEAAVAATQQMDGKLSVIFIDADHFKPVNDTFGHQAGDIALIEMARRISEVIPENGLACRYGGEEFVVMLPGRSRAEAARVAEAIRTAISAAPIDVRDADCGRPTVEVTASLGVASIEPESAGVLTSAARLVKAADQALYHAKLNGRNMVQVFVPRQRGSIAA